MRCRGHRITLAVSLVVLGAGVAGSVALAGSSGASAPTAGRLRAANFIVICGFSHRAPDDPIVFPGQPGKSHDHSFVGSTSTNASSTIASLEASATTCHRQADTAAYWMPTLVADGDPVAPTGATIYYRRKTRSQVQPLPSGMKIIAGDANATSPQLRSVTFWNCGTEALVPATSSVPTCPNDRGSFLRLHVRFPSCWDGQNLDSANHKSHMSYPVGRRCPRTHPVAVPEIELIYRYPIYGGSGVYLSSGGQYSGHADFVNAWNQAELTRLVKQCLNALKRCGRN